MQDIKEQQPITQETRDPQTIREQKKAESEALSSLTLGQNPTEEFNSILIKEFKEMNGTTEEKVKRLFNRLQKFFLRDKGARINIKDGYFCKKRQPFLKLKGVHILDNQIILFGVDFAKHRDIIRAYQPDDFCPVDMSHVKLIYSDFFSAMDALRRNQRQGVQENSLKLQQGLQEPSQGWMEMKPYYISNYERRILARFATSEELELANTSKLECNIPLFAKKVYDLRKKQSADVMENCRLRQQRLQIKKHENRERRAYQNNRYNDENENQDNFNEKLSEKSYTLNIGKGKGKVNEEDDKSSVSYSYRQRSRQKDFDKESVCSKASSLSNLANLANKMKIDDKMERESVVSDASFILDQNDENEEVFRDMAMRLANMGLGGMAGAGERNHQESEASLEIPNLNQSVASHASSASYRLSDNMPDRPDPHNDSSISSEPFNYRRYMEEQERLEEQKRREQKEVVIVIDDE